MNWIYRWIFSLDLLYDRLNRPFPRQNLSYVNELYIYGNEKQQQKNNNKKKKHTKKNNGITSINMSFKVVTIISILSDP